MAAYGFHMDDVFQGENLAGVIREFEGILLDGNFKIPDNSLLKSHFLNVALKHNMETRKLSGLSRLNSGRGSTALYQSLTQ